MSEAIARWRAEQASHMAGRPPLNYLSVCPSLPTGRPLGFPHIIDLDTFDPAVTNITNLSCADGIATLLWNWNQREFRRFLNRSSADRFKLHHRAPETVFNKMHIIREDTEVTVSCILSPPCILFFMSCRLLPLLTPSQLAWRKDGVVTYIMFEILSNGSWEGRSYSTDKVVDDGSDAETDPTIAEAYGMVIAEALLDGKTWLVSESGRSMRIVE